ncbi:hypothetical protein NQZ68_023151 [Dissostichus eleginoides]|nr:hypothetical protein NQZ68_023151 [Dissostichus eleginoides]
MDVRALLIVSSHPNSFYDIQQLEMAFVTFTDRVIYSPRLAHLALTGVDSCYKGCVHRASSHGQQLAVARLHDFITPEWRLSRRVALRPQRVPNTAAHFTACKAIISIPTFPLSFPPPAAGTAESAHLHMESGFLNRDVIDLPLFVRGKCSQASQANFAALHSQENRWALPRGLCWGTRTCQHSLNPETRDGWPGATSALSCVLCSSLLLLSTLYPTPSS